MSSAHIVPIGDAARRLGLSVETLRRMDKDGRLPSTRIGGRRHYSVQQLEAFVARQRTPNEAA